MMALVGIAGLFAPYGDRWGPGGGMWLGPLWLVFWVGLIGAVVWLAARSRRQEQHSPTARAAEILAERYARGEINGEEYRERLDQLRSSAA